MPAVGALLGMALPGLADYGIRDGDTVVFLGDSITAARTYGKIVENYTLLRFPGRKVRFINAGQGGDTAAGGLTRLERDVFHAGATVLFVAYGVNDIGWGMKADEEHKKLYRDSIRGIVEQCKKRKVRVFICSAAVMGVDPEKSEGDALQKLCDEGMEISRSLGEGAIDVQRTMRAIQKKIWEHNRQEKDESQKVTLHTSDGIHLSDLGQLAMAYAILKGLDAPAVVSSATVDAAKAQAVEAKGCAVTEVKATADGIEFVRLDEALPINFGLFGFFSFRWVPIPEMNRYSLTVAGLSAGKYEVLADSRSLGTFTHEQLAAGIDIASATGDGWQPGGPWDVQSSVLRQVTDARNDLASGRWLAAACIPGSPSLPSLKDQMDKLDESLMAVQRTAAKATPYRFVVRAK